MQEEQRAFRSELSSMREEQTEFRSELSSIRVELTSFRQEQTAFNEEQKIFNEKQLSFNEAQKSFNKEALGRFDTLEKLVLQNGDKLDSHRDYVYKKIDFIQYKNQELEQRIYELENHYRGKQP